MTKMAKWTSLILAALCLLWTPVVIAPSLAFAQGAEEEYDLDLPGSGGDQSTPSTNTTNSSDSEDDGFPVLVIVLFAAAGVAVGLAVWRLAVGRRLEESSDEESDEAP